MPDQVPDNERAILEALLDIRSQLLAIKKNRSSYIKSDEITSLYNALIAQIAEINRIRTSPSLENEQNRLDVVLDDVFHLISLGFMTLGKNHMAAATFASLGTVHCLLLHLKESQVFSDNDTKPIKKRLEELEAIIKADIDSVPPEILPLIQKKVEICNKTLREVEESMKIVAPGLTDMFKRLVAIKREILSIGAHDTESYDHIHDELIHIETERVDGEFVSEDGNHEGQALLNGLLEECHNLLEDFSASSISNSLPQGTIQETYNDLIDMKHSLETLLITKRWALRETDLFVYQKRLNSIDKVAQGAEFNAASNKVQAILLYLLRRCYAILYKLLESSEPISESLVPIHNNLKTVRRCLLEVQRVGGISSPRELYPYQMKLTSIEALRKDGKFVVDGTIPEGQGMLNALLAECFDICQELKAEMH
ncbi:hypothetical protein DV451_004494 [Geotrichum candidum]|uniref:Uncharacterized protein n=1 Tax=Geotrichum candidum TaxID=1173061 RepID=A0A9P5G163_GEOCN|nr:hypothetical protein DV451_004494 [Geotrichum candidum]